MASPLNLLSAPVIFHQLNRRHAMAKKFLLGVNA